jgi:hypothetical protein
LVFVVTIILHYKGTANILKQSGGIMPTWGGGIDMDITYRTLIFSTALTRLDELPLRFMDKNNHGSPWQELLNNPTIIKIFRDKPEAFKEYLDLAKSALSKSEDKGNV